MKRKTLLAGIACLAIMVSSLSGCTLFGGDKNKETPSSVALESPEPTKEPEQSAVVQATFSFRRSLKRRIKLTSVFEDRSFF